MAWAILSTQMDTFCWILREAERHYPHVSRQGPDDNEATVTAVSLLL